MSSFGELVLIVGDFHIPDRAHVIPEKFQRMLVPNKMQHVICTGNLGMEQYEELRTLAPNLHVVAGDYHYDGCYSSGGVQSGNITSSLQFPETAVVQVGQFRIGVIHGHQIIPWGYTSTTATKNDEEEKDNAETSTTTTTTTTTPTTNSSSSSSNHDALARIRRKLNVDILVTGHTHQNEVVSHDGYYHINPGSITGAFSSITKNVVPSFILLAVKDNSVVCYVYEYIDGNVDVSKTEFSKTSTVS